MRTLTALIVDDEVDSVELLKLQLKKYCPNVSGATSFTNPVAAYQHLCEVPDPDILFLDIDMPGLNGFELLEKLAPRRFNVIFVTAYNEFAVRAFRMNALDYLSKPVEGDDLKEAVNRLLRQSLPESLQLLQLQKMLAGQQAETFALATQSGVVFIKLQEIVLAEAINNYVKFYLADGKTLIASRNLKELQDILEISHFLRIHRSYMINLKRVKKYQQVDGLLTMDNDMEIPVARPQRQKLKERFTWI